MLANTSDFGAYRGRFAPSPSGPLHFGSLVAALGSYLDAKAHNGLWLVRIEDIDTPRVVAGSDTLILRTLENYGLYWDESIRYQSECLDHYQEVLNTLTNAKQVYACKCTRKEIKQHGGFYTGHCRDLGLDFEQQALRLKQSLPTYQFNDLFKGNIIVESKFAEEDYIIKRRDGLFAYQLVVVLDDIAQQISHIVRGADLLFPTVRQISLYKLLGAKVPQFGHLPLAVAEPGFKLSKQNYAAAIDMDKPQQTLLAALNFLGLDTEAQLISATVEEIIHWAVNIWQREHVPANDEIQLIPNDNSFTFKPL
ncbi:tRNA glutamyl-Q(34) synthetase GluQRS [Pseudoalteromonas sp. G4]|uniref:tRNA glutamyl-Q(34) synthetase GluQRS n=1 Tax=Pseudoalteromonas sp. G4 TaxID=2992761 RepID=UPI00237D9D73|nr:tRNA glutamyl-Q(34) synthetase GluQRS [Pseudoalteromonas sp. G4]MDE3272183.1 tRNA glutamyl-Q(34) synthetase GluQRS [Pseudoalteromonas sp. G4]